MDLRKVALIVTIAVAYSVLGTLICEASGQLPDETGLQEKLQEIFDSRARAVITGADPGPALTGYETSALVGRWAMSHEQAKLNYIQQWAEKRGVRMTEANPTLVIPWVQVRGDTAEVIVHQSLQLGYVYPDDPEVNRFGIGTRHWMELVRKDGNWLIQQDFYTDGLGDDSLAPNPTPADGASPLKPGIQRTNKGGEHPTVLNREEVVRYADQYAGLAWGAGNDHKSNERYADLSGSGGDCANYVSQCLADREGGKLPMDGTWFYDRAEAEGSQAWVRAQTFADWLMYCGRGRRIARGTFAEMVSPNATLPAGAAGELQKGDVIGYGMKGDVDHLSIVVGRDSKGYPLVNSHNVDRYHCPWDMGYDRSTVFHFFRVNDEL